MRVSKCVEVYIEHRQACGYAYTAIAKVLRRFARSVGRLNISLVADQHVSQFLRGAPISNNTWRIYARHLHKFFIFWFACRQIRRIPKPEMKPAVANTFYPHVYTREEIRRLLDTAATCQRAPRCTVGPETLRTIILFLYGTGIRIGDALTVLDSDVDFANASVRVRDNSVLQSRVIPIGHDIWRLLRRHINSDERKQFGSGKSLFLSVKGTAVPYAIICNAFRRLRTIAGVKRADSSYQPRMHDLRHTFAVHSIEQWTRDGLAHDKMVPMLATYMGNWDMHGLERYFELSPCSYQKQLDLLTVQPKRR